MPAIERRYAQRAVTIANTENLSEEFYFGPYTFLSVETPSAWTTAKIGFKVARESGGTFVPLYDDSGALVQIDPGTDRTHSAPAEIAGQMYVKLWSQDGAANNVAQGADRELGLIMKG